MSEKLTISQCLRQTKKIKRQLADLLSRAQASVSHRTDSPPAFSFENSVAKADALRAELIQLESCLALTNSKTTFDLSGKVVTLAYAVRSLQELKGRISWYKSLGVRAQETTVEQDWSFDDDMKRVQVKTEWKCHLPEVAKAEIIDSLQGEFDKINDAVEHMNHITLLERL